jgi:hypothetical protein
VEGSCEFGTESLSIPIKMDVCVYVCMSGYNSGTP